jgi:hypothetical protein
MSSLFETLSQQLSGNTTQQISRELGADEQATGQAISAALPVLFSALARNAAKPQGAEALAAALSKDHDGGILDSITGFLGNAQAGPGDAILRHTLGGKRQAVEMQLGQQAGLDGSTVSKLLPMLAPLVMGALGRAQREQGLDSGKLAELLGGERQRAEQAAPGAMGMMGQLLDSDGDGEIMDDVTKLAKGLLPGFFGTPGR